ncbi:MAG TPA: hypothetical protein VMF08_07500 [Candidatus Sulfotelmatobacter sp.]|nr:hypothetical protein [Candidatus Sulfotelmatobacter sp.]
MKAAESQLKQVAETERLGDVPSSVATSSGSAEDQIAALRREVEEARDAYRSNNDTSRKPWETYCQLNDTNLPKIFELGRQEPASEAAFKAFAWIVTNGRISVRSLRPFGSQSLEFLRDFHTTHPDIGEICRQLGRTWDPMDKTAMEFLRAASENNPERNARGYATLALGQMLKGRVGFAFLGFVVRRLYANGSVAAFAF